MTVADYEANRSAMDGTRIVFPPNEATMRVLDSRGFRPVRNSIGTYTRAKNFDDGYQIYVWWRDWHNQPGVTCVYLGYPCGEDESDHESGIRVGDSWDEASLAKLVDAAIGFIGTIAAIQESEVTL